MEMMAILSREYSKQIVLLDKVIVDLKLALIPYTKHAMFVQLQTDLKNALSVFNQDTLQTKEIQFLRDKSAFLEGRDYRWNVHPTPSGKNYSSREQ